MFLFVVVAWFSNKSNGKVGADIHLSSRLGTYLRIAIDKSVSHTRDMPNT